MPLSEPIVVVVPSHSQPNTSYTVVFPTIEQPYCNCKGFGYRRTCSHIQEAANSLLNLVLKEQLAQAAANEQPTCTTCGQPITTSTHAASPVSKCMACYRAETFSKARSTSRPLHHL